MISYITPGEAREYIGANSESATIEYVVESVSRLIDQYTGDFFGRSGTTAEPEDRTFTPEHGVVTFGPFNSLVELVSADADVELVEVPWRPELTPYRQLTCTADSVTVSGVWGWPSIPAAVKMACRMQSAHVFKRQDSPLGVAGFGEFGVVRVPARLDADVARLLDPYRRGDWVGVA